MIENTGKNIDRIVKTSSLKYRLNSLKKVLNNIKKDFNKIKDSK
jgi:hypothetical protein